LEERERELGITPDRLVAGFMKAAGQGEHRRLAADIVMKALGLEGVANTRVGNSMIRGVSGATRPAPRPGRRGG
jgi:hypothetical protein